MKDVARLADVSTATVSHVINGTRNVKPETREKVLQAIERLNYNVHTAARTLRTGASRTIGYVVSNLSDYFFLDISVIIIDKILRKNGYHLIYINSNEDQELEKENIRDLLVQNVDGLIIAPVHNDCSYMNSVIGNRCPAVFFDRKPLGFHRDYILSENREGALKGTELLVKKGHKRIGFIGSRDDLTIHERIEGYRDALIKHGIPYDESLVKLGAGVPLSMYEQKTGDGYESARYLVEEKNVTALFSGNAISAVGAEHYIKQKNIQIPEDLAFITFDETFWLTIPRTSITAISQDKYGIGEAVATTLLKRIHGDTSDYREIRIPTGLELRESC